MSGGRVTSVRVCKHARVILLKHIKRWPKEALSKYLKKLKKNKKTSLKHFLYENFERYLK